MNGRVMVGTKVGRIAGRDREDAPLSENGFGCMCVECMGKPLLQKQGLLIHLLTGSFLSAEKRRDWGIRVSDKVTRSSSTNNFTCHLSYP